MMHDNVAWAFIVIVLVAWVIAHWHCAACSCSR